MIHSEFSILFVLCGGGRRKSHMLGSVFLGVCYIIKHNNETNRIMHETMLRMLREISIMINTVQCT